MKPREQWSTVDRLLVEALEQSAPDRASYVRLRAEKDQELSSEVLELLDACEAAGQFLERPLHIDPESIRRLFFLIALHAVKVSAGPDEDEAVSG